MPKDANTFLNGMVAVDARNFGQLTMQFGCVPSFMYEVKCLVTVISDDFETISSFLSPDAPYGGATRSRWYRRLPQNAGRLSASGIS